MSFVDLLDLNLPRGLLDLASNGHQQSQSKQSPFSTPDSDFIFDYPMMARSSPLSPAGSGGLLTSPDYSFGRQSSLPSASTFSKAPGGFHGNPTRNYSLNDSLYSTSPSVPSPSSPWWTSNSRSNSPKSNSSNGSVFAGQSLSDMMNIVTLNDAIIRNNQMRQNEFEHRNNTVPSLQSLRQLPMSMMNRFPTSPAANPIERWNNSGPGFPPCNDSIPLEQAVRFQRKGTTLYDASCTWSGVLPERNTFSPNGLSNKVFLGGVPWDVTEQSLMQTFNKFGTVAIEWPGKDRQMAQPKGYVYIIFESERSVRALLEACSEDVKNPKKWYYKVSSKRMKSKDVQVIPWFLNDSNYTKSSAQKLDASKTVFVGALHGMLNAEGLAKIMNDLFDGVVYSGIDTDKHKYPIGSGRVTFDNPLSYIKAVRAAFVEIKTNNFCKKLQLDPYLEDSLCSNCGVQQGPYFCRDMFCFCYFCRSCWQLQHNFVELKNHRPLMRNTNKNQSGQNAGFRRPAVNVNLNDCRLKIDVL